MKHSTAPDAPALRAAPNPTYPGHYTVEVTCPYCNGIHVHGWAGPGIAGGHRVAHCWSPAARKINSAGYIITIPGDLELEVQK